MASRIMVMMSMLVSRAALLSCSGVVRCPRGRPGRV
jgi:hypothetical protein